MEDIVYVAMGVLLAFPLLYLVNKILGSKALTQKKEEKVGYVSTLNKRFDTLLEASYKKDTSKFNQIYNELSENEQSIFKRFMEAKLEKGGEKEQVVDPNQITKWDVIKWFASLIVEAAVVTAVAYFLYIYLKG